MGVPEGGAAAVPPDPLKEHGTMQAAFAPRGDAHTWLTHFVGNGLDDDRYVVQHKPSSAMQSPQT